MTKKYNHYISVPLVTALEMVVTSENPNPSIKELYELACKEDWQIKEVLTDHINVSEHVAIFKTLDTGNINYFYQTKLMLEETEEE